MYKLIAVHVIFIFLFGVIFGAIGLFLKEDVGLVVIGMFVGEVVAVFIWSNFINRNE